MCHPYIFLVHRVSDPQIAVGRHPVALLNATHILWSATLVVAAIAHRGHLTADEIQRRVVETVAAQRYSQGPPELRRVVNGGIGTVGEALPPYLRVAVDEPRRTLRQRPRPSAVAADRGQGVFPQSHKGAVAEGIVVVSLIAVGHGDKGIVAVGLLNPLHTIAGIGQNLLTGLAHSSWRMAVVGIGGVAFVEAVVIIYEVDGAETAVLPHLADDTSDAVAVVGIVLPVEGDTIIAHGEEYTVGGDIPSHALVHDGFQRQLLVGIGVLERWIGLIIRFREPFRHVVGGKELYWIGPVIAVSGGLHHRMRWRHMLLGGVGKVVDVEPPVPICHHRLVVVGPPVAVGGSGMFAVGTQDLNVVDTDDGRQPTVVSGSIGDGRARIVNTVRLEHQSKGMLRHPEDGAMLMSYGHFDDIGHIFKLDEIAGKGGAEALFTIIIVVDEPSVTNGIAVGEGCHRRSFCELGSERCRRRRPRTERVTGESHTEVALGTGVILEDHDIIVVATLHNCGVNATETGVVEELAGGEGAEILRRRVVKALVVVVLFQSVGEPSRHTRTPHDHGLLPLGVPEELGSPDVDSRGVGHDADEFHVGPVHEVAAFGIAKPTVATPRAGPHEAIDAVGGADDGGIAQHFLLADTWFEEDIGHRLPVDGIIAVDETEAIGGRFVERCRHVILFLLHGRMLSSSGSGHGCQRQKQTNNCY